MGKRGYGVVSQEKHNCKKEVLCGWNVHQGGALTFLRVSGGKKEMRTKKKRGVSGTKRDSQTAGKRGAVGTKKQKKEEEMGREKDR